MPNTFYLDGTSAIWETWTSYTDSSTSVGTITATTANETTQARPVQQETEEMRIARERQRQKKRESQERALEFLRTSLNPEQLAQFEMDKTFIVSAKARRFKVREYGHVHEIDGEGKIIRQFCIDPRATVPSFDVMLTKKLMLDCHPDDFLRIANVH